MVTKKDFVLEILESWLSEYPNDSFESVLEEVRNKLPAELRHFPLTQIRAWIALYENRKAALESEYPELRDFYDREPERREEQKYALYELVIPLLRLEIRRRGRETDGLVAGKDSPAEVASEAGSADQQEFKHSSDYRSVSLRGLTYSLTPAQALIIQVLYEAYENRTPDISTTHILDRLGNPSARWQDSFKSNLRAKKALIRRGESKGTLRLNI
jgi:hypothetical protein